MNTKQAQPQTADKRQKLIDGSGYDVRDGIIVSPGKFEGENLYALHYWNIVLDGCSDETVYDGETPIDLFTITDEDKAMFPELAEYKSISLYTSEQGFVYCEEHTESVEEITERFTTED